MKAFSLRPVCPSDAAGLQHNCFPECTLDEVREYLRYCLAQGATGRIERLVAEADGQVIASGQLTILGDRGEIGSLSVAPPYRRRGIGTALVLALIEKARERNVRTLEITAGTGTPWIQAWYQRFGFVFQGNHTFPGQEEVAILRMALTDPDEEAP